MADTVVGILGKVCLFLLNSSSNAQDNTAFCSLSPSSVDNPSSPGGGQLGRMLGAAASLLNIPVVILDKGHGPAKQVLATHSHVDGSFSDPEKIRELASQASVLTVEIEHVNVATLEEIAAEFPNLPIHPAPSAIRVIQDKFLQKEHLSRSGCPVGPYLLIESTPSSVAAAGEAFGYPFMVKSRKLAYDGQGNFVVREASDISSAISSLSKSELYAEKWVPYVKELAVMVVKSRDGEILSYPPVETVHKENICHLVFAPLRSGDPSLAARAQVVAEDAVRTFQGAGVFGVEMFLLDDGTILINEIAPRPHNSGHYTIESCLTSQYSNHLRAILGLPLGSTQLKVASTAMLNLVGFSPSISEINAIVDVALTTPGCYVHLYGKTECRKGRKMGHITLVGDSDSQIHQHLRPLLEKFPSYPTTDLDSYAPIPPGPSSGQASTAPLVGVIMGSDSDLPVMLPAARILDRFKIPYELTIVSAHRTPDRLVSYARSAASRGIRVIIAGAGGAAHLPGMVAALTPLPVIGVPVKGSTLDGVDSLYSIVQMPRGIPVATVAINNSTNAGLLAVRMISVAIPCIMGEMATYMTEMDNEVMGKVGKLGEVGWEKYEVKK